jgi:hypothetical protein
VLPLNFQAESSDDKLLAFGDLVINDFNWWPPTSGYTRENWPETLDGTYIIGASVFASLFKQMEASLQDFEYNDNGLSVRVDQVGKINTQHINMLNIYKQQVEYAKKSLLIATGGQGLGSPRFQSQIGQFIKIALGSSMTWSS